MRSPILGLVVLLSALGCQRKAATSSEADPHQMAIESVASFTLLEEIESEDPYLAAALTEDDIASELEKRAAKLRSHVDINQNGQIDGDEFGRLKGMVKDKMLEQFDIDSDGSFNQSERSAIQDKIHARIENSRNQTSLPKT